MGTESPSVLRQSLAGTLGKKLSVFTFHLTSGEDAKHNFASRAECEDNRSPASRCAPYPSPTTFLKREPVLRNNLQIIAFSRDLWWFSSDWLRSLGHLLNHSPQMSMLALHEPPLPLAENSAAGLEAEFRRSLASRLVFADIALLGWRASARALNSGIATTLTNRQKWRNLKLLRRPHVGLSS